MTKFYVVMNSIGEVFNTNARCFEQIKVSNENARINDKAEADSIQKEQEAKGYECLVSTVRCAC